MFSPPPQSISLSLCSVRPLSRTHSVCVQSAPQSAFSPPLSQIRSVCIQSAPSVCVQSAPESNSLSLCSVHPLSLCSVRPSVDLAQSVFSPPPRSNSLSLCSVRPLGRTPSVCVQSAPSVELPQSVFSPPPRSNSLSMCSVRPLSRSRSVCVQSAPSVELPQYVFRLPVVACAWLADETEYSVIHIIRSYYHKSVARGQCSNHSYIKTKLRKFILSLQYAFHRV